MLLLLPTMVEGGGCAVMVDAGVMVGVVAATMAEGGEAARKKEREEKEITVATYEVQIRQGHDLNGKKQHEVRKIFIQKNVIITRLMTLMTVIELLKHKHLINTCCMNQHLFSIQISILQII